MLYCSYEKHGCYMKSLRININEKLWKQLQYFCIDNNTNLSNLVRKLLREFIDENPRPNK